MKRLFLLLSTLFLCSSPYAKEQTVVYKIKQKGYPYGTITCKGNFTNGVLSDGPVIFSYKGYNDHDRITLTGIYRSDSTYTFYGIVNTPCLDKTELSCYGTIYNNKENRTISKKSSANNWKINLQFYTFIGNNPQIKAVINDTPPLLVQHHIDNNPQIKVINIPFHATSEFSARGKLIKLAWEQLFSETIRLGHGATVYFPDGCKYIGPIYWSNRPDHTTAWWIGAGWNNKTPVVCQYIWPNGDSFTGQIYTNHSEGDTPNPLNGGPHPQRMFSTC